MSIVERVSGIGPWWRTRAPLGIGFAALGITMWSVVLIPSGMGIGELIAFVPPAAALGVFMRWLSFAFAPARWTWQSGLRAAIVSGVILPPLLAALVTLAGLQRPSHLLVLFVLGAWIALGIGLVTSAFEPTVRNTTGRPSTPKVNGGLTWLRRMRRWP